MNAESESASSAGGNWSGPFSNLMMLLFALFVVLYATTKADVKRLEDETAHLRSELELKKNPPPAETSSAPAASTPGETASAELQSGIAAVVDALFREANPQSRSSQTWVEFEDLGEGSFLLRISPEGLFQPGEAKVDPKMRPLLDRLGELIRKSSRKLKVEGHADYEDAELLSRQGGESADAKNTWELSARRSAWVAQYWMRKFDFDPLKMEVVAFGKFRPLPGKKGLPSGNRRLEIVIEKQ